MVILCRRLGRRRPCSMAGKPALPGAEPTGASLARQG
jgi:hypothetical protein